MKAKNCVYTFLAPSLSRSSASFCNVLSPVNTSQCRVLIYVYVCVCGFYRRGKTKKRRGRKEKKEFFSQISRLLLLLLPSFSSFLFQFDNSIFRSMCCIPRCAGKAKPNYKLLYCFYPLLRLCLFLLLPCCVNVYVRRRRKDFPDQWTCCKSVRMAAETTTNESNCLVLLFCTCQ